MPTAPRMTKPNQSNGSLSMGWAMRSYKKMVIGILAIAQNIHAGKPDFSEYCGWSFINFKDSVVY